MSSDNGTEPPVDDRPGDPVRPDADSAVPAIEPGTYRWDGFGRPISVTVDSGWEIGHDDPAFFDLFRGSDSASVSFARFTDVYVDGVKRSAATDAAAVAATLGHRTHVSMTDPTAIELGGRDGLQFDLTTTAPKTPLSSMAQLATSDSSLHSRRAIGSSTSRLAASS